MTKKTTKKETKEEPVLEVATEVVPTEDLITQGLAAHNITETRLAEMETNYLPLVINGIDDKDGYKAVYEARIACKNTRIITTKFCKEVRDESIKFQKAVIAKEKEIVGRIENVETLLAARQKEIDDLIEAKKKEREILEQNRLQERSALLLQKYKMQLVEGHYLLPDGENTIKISTVQLKSSDEFNWGQILAEIEPVAAKIAEFEAIQEKAREDAAAEAKRQAEENLRKAEELAKQEVAIKARQDALDAAEAKAKLDAEAALKVKEAALKAAAEATLKSRKSSLFQLGFAQQGDYLIFQDIKLHEAQISGFLDLDWIDELGIITGKVDMIKKRIEAENAAREEKIKQDAIEAEKKRVAEEAEKAEKDRLAKEAEEARVAALLPDIDKLKGYLKAVSAVPIPEFSTEAFQTFGPEMKKQVTACLTAIFTQQPK